VPAPAATTLRLLRATAHHLWVSPMAKCRRAPAAMVVAAMPQLSSGVRLLLRAMVMAASATRT
ncbi:hypothetical protein LTR66_015510, partial [Elasticomyces elasticus]